MFYNPKTMFDLARKPINLIISGRGNGKNYFLYQQRKQELNTIGYFIINGLCEGIKPNNEKLFNDIIVYNLSCQEQVRKYFKTP